MPFHHFPYKTNLFRMICCRCRRTESEKTNFYFKCWNEELRCCSCFVFLPFHSNAYRQNDALKPYCSDACYFSWKLKRWNEMGIKNHFILSLFHPFCTVGAKQSAQQPEISKTEKKMHFDHSLSLSECVNVYACMYWFDKRKNPTIAQNMAHWLHFQAQTVSNKTIKYVLW